MDTLKGIVFSIDKGLSIYFSNPVYSRLDPYLDTPSNNVHHHPHSPNTQTMHNLHLPTTQSSRNQPPTLSPSPSPSLPQQLPTPDPKTLTLPHIQQTLPHHPLRAPHHPHPIPQAPGPPDLIHQGAIHLLQLLHGAGTRDLHQLVEERLREAGIGDEVRAVGHCGDGGAGRGGVEEGLDGAGVRAGEDGDGGLGVLGGRGLGVGVAGSGILAGAVGVRGCCCCGGGGGGGGRSCF